MKPVLCNDQICTGCSACVNACNKGALTIGQNVEGFYRPTIDEEKCVGCGMCEISCPVKNPLQRQADKRIKVIACWHKDESVRVNSSSGGAFSALAQTVIRKGGVVVGAAYEENLSIRHIVVDDWAGIDRLRLSKYAQSDCGTVFSEIKELLKSGKIVFFTGTPCQGAGLRSYLKCDYENLIIADIICHGVPSIYYLQKYTKWLELKYGMIAFVNFRDKQKGWYDNLRVIRNQEGESFSLKGKDDAYWVGFNKNNCLQYSCYDCRFQNFPRFSDLTLADFWRIGQIVPFGNKDEIEKGISMVVTYNEKAESLVDQSSEVLERFPRSLKEAVCGNQAGVKKNIMPESRKFFYSDLKVMPFADFSRRYLSVNWKECLVKFFRERLPYGMIKYFRLKSQK